MIEDILAQAHVLVDTLTFDQGTIALSTLRTISNSDTRVGAFSRVLGVQFSEFGEGRCTASLEVKQHLLNPHGIAHGGVTYSLADTVCGGAAVSVVGEPRIVTQDIQIRYHAPARTGSIIASAEVIHQGQRTVTTLGRVTQDKVLIASVSATFAILSDDQIAAIKQAT
jgi:acyl-CoA thioesterase